MARSISATAPAGPCSPIACLSSLWKSAVAATWKADTWPDRAGLCAMAQIGPASGSQFAAIHPIRRAVFAIRDCSGPSRDWPTCQRRAEDAPRGSHTCEEWRAGQGLGL